MNKMPSGNKTVNYEVSIIKSMFKYDHILKIDVSEVKLIVDFEFSSVIDLFLGSLNIISKYLTPSNTILFVSFPIMQVGRLPYLRYLRHPNI